MISNNFSVLWLLVIIGCCQLAAAQTTCSLGIPTNQSSPNSYPLASGLLHIFTWMKVACDGQISQVSFINRQTVTSTTRFYLGAFEAIPMRTGSFRLVNFVAIELQSLETGWQTVTLPFSRLLTVQTGQYLGYFYDRWDLPAQSSLILPYKLGATDAETNKYKTYVGFQSLRELRDIKELKSPGELQPNPTGRIVALNVTIIKNRQDLVSCGDALTIPKGYIIARTSNGVYLAGDYVNYACIDGYALQGNFYSTCQNDGTWSTLPICMPSCGSEPQIPNAQILYKSFEKVSRIGDTVDYVCNSGFILASGSVRRIICEENSRWSLVPLCISNENETNETTTTTTPNPATATTALPISCGAAPQIDMALISSRNFDSSNSVPLSEVRYQCQDGYEFTVGTGLVICGYDGNWGNLPKCVKPGSQGTTAAPVGITCSDPFAISNGELVSATFQLQQRAQHGESVTYACNTGYTLNGNRLVTCQSDGSWSEVPQCVATSTATQATPKCGPAPGLDNGRIQRTSDDGNQVVYECNNQFTLSGSEIVTCSGNTWSTMPACRPLSVTSLVTTTINPETINSICGLAPTVRYATMTGYTDMLPGRDGGEQVTFTCINGFTMQGPESVMCQTQPLGWTQIPRCLPPLSCGPAPVVANSEIDTQDFIGSSSRAESTVRYRCLGAYVIGGGSDTAVCNGNTGMWSQVPTCNYQTCGQPLNVENGRIESQSFSGVTSGPGATVTYVCTNGYTMSGSNTVTCDSETWRWTVPPVCRGASQSCGLPPGVKNGAITTSSIITRSASGDYVFYQCDEGYSLQGNNYVACVDNKWTTAPTCVLACGNNGPVIANADIASQSWTTGPASSGDTVIYRCSDGYQFAQGSVTEVRCLPTLRWSTPFPQCIPQTGPRPTEPTGPPSQCGQPPSIANARIAQRYQNAVRYACQGNYVIKDFDTTACQSDLSWSPIPECIQSCGAAPNVPNAKITWKSFNGTFSQPSSVVRYACDSGQPTPGADSVICGENGKWSTVPSCVTCGLPPVVVNARVDYQTFKADASQPGSVARYACQLGMQIRGTDTVICGSNGKWSTAPVCSQNNCGLPPNVANAVILSKSFSGTNGVAGDRVIYGCRTDAGYFVLRGNYSVVCEFERLQWSTPPTCEGDVNSCGYVSAVTNGFIAASSVPVGGISKGNDFVFYSCNAGFVLNGRDLVECKNGRWSQIPTCISSCGTNGPGVPNAVVTKKSFRNYAVIGDTVEYTCMSGYQLSPESRASITCLNTWRWTQLPLCTPISDGTDTGVRITPGTVPVGNLVSKCGEAPTIENGYVTKQTIANNVTSFLDSTEYTCNSTYRMLGLNIIFCQSNGIWSTPPQCISFATKATTKSPLIGCSTPAATISNGRLLSQNFERLAVPSTSFVQYKCNRGFVLSGSNNNYVTCGDGGTWAALPSCVPDRRNSADIPTMCDYPPTLLNGRINETNMGVSGQLELGDYVVHVCNYGYDLVGNGRVWCEGSVEGVSWSNPPICKATTATAGTNPSYCGKSPDVANADKIRFQYGNSDFGTNMAQPGDLVFYSCRDGYVLVGSSDGAAQCTAGPPATWQNVPTCSDKTCGPPPTLLNGGLVSAAFTSGNRRYGGPGDTLYYSCDSGYSMTGPETVTCSGDGDGRSWSVMPKCVRMNGDDMTLNFPAGGNTGARGTTTTLKHPETTTAKPAATTTRNKQQMKSEDDLFLHLPMDADVDVCGPISPVANAFIVSQVSPNERSYPIGTILQYSCNSGYTLDVTSIDTVICTPQGWSTPPICQKSVRAIDFSPCRQPPSIENGFISGVNGSVVSYLCKLGYAFADRTLNNVTCRRATATWTTAPTCVPAGCGAAPIIRHAHLTVKTFDMSSIPDDKAFYQCDPGFQVRDAAYIVITCQAAGGWSQGGVCEPADNVQSSSVSEPDGRIETCGPTPTLENGKVIYTQYLSGTPANGGLGDTVFFACNDGFAMAGDRQVVCSSTPLKWSPLPTCTRSSSCTVIPVVTSGFIASQTATNAVPAVGDTVTFQCADGWKLEGSATISCTSSGWSLAPRCVRQAAATCGRAPTVTNGAIIYSDFEEGRSQLGSRAFYRCNEGYVITTVPSSSICQENGQWSPPPRCLRASDVLQVRCTMPPAVTNGVVIYKSYDVTPMVGSLVMYDCSEGYSLTTRNNYVQCAADGSWTEVPKCTRRMSCGTIPSITNGRVSGKTFSTDSGSQDDRVFYSCESGYTLSGGNSFIRCDESGSWSVLPACVRQSTSCPQLRSVDNAQVVFRSQKGDTAMENDVVWFSCTAGYRIQGKEVVRCQTDGTWTTLPTCAPSSGVNCNGPTAVDNGVIYYRSFADNGRPSSGDFVRYKCSDGYTLSTATDESTCTVAGTWTDPPQCRPNGQAGGCGTAPTIENAKITFTTILGGGHAVINDIVWYECLTGFELDGSSAVRCLASGSWTPSPRCRYQISDTCGAPPPVNKGFISQPYHGPSVTGSQVVYACQTGFKLFGTAQVTCQSNGKWSTIPRCESVSSQVSCGAVPQIENGKAIESNFAGDASDVTSYVIYACNSGYVLKGQTRIECLGSGGWTQSPRCELRPTTGTTCGAIPNVPNSVVAYNTVPANTNFSIVGDIVWYQCLEGYTTTSYPGISCTSKGWSGQPQCTPIKRYRCSSSMSLLFALDLQESDGFTRNELQNVVTFLKSVIPTGFHKITDMKGATSPDTTSFSTGAVTLTGVTASREYVSKSVTVTDESSSNNAAVQQWNDWLDSNIAEFKHALNDDLAKLLQTIRTTLLPQLPLTASDYSTSLRVVYLTTARRGTSLVEAQGEAAALQLLGGRIFVMAVGDALSALTQQTALRQQVATDASYFRYFSTAKLMSLDTLSSDAAFQNFFCGPNK